MMRITVFCLCALPRVFSSLFSKPGGFTQAIWESGSASGAKNV